MNYKYLTKTILIIITIYNFSSNLIHSDVARAQVVGITPPEVPAIDPTDVPAIIPTPEEPTPTLLPEDTPTSIPTPEVTQEPTIVPIPTSVPTVSPTTIPTPMVIPLSPTDVPNKNSSKDTSDTSVTATATPAPVVQAAVIQKPTPTPTFPKTIASKIAAKTYDTIIKAPLQLLSNVVSQNAYASQKLSNKTTILLLVIGIFSIFSGIFLLKKKMI